MKSKKIASNIFAYLMLFALMAFSVNAAQSAVNLGTAGNFVILTKSGVSTTGTTSITGDIGVSPIDSTAITGFGLIMDSSNEFSTSSLVTGKIYAADYTMPTPTKMTAAVSDMETAFIDAAGRTNPTATELGAGDISGMTIAPGLYKWGTGVLINNGVAISGGANDVWIFQIAQDLTVGEGAIITLSGGAQAKNIFWQVAGTTILGTTSDFKGIILSQTAIVLNTGATLKGRALAQTAVTLDANAVTAPTGSSASTPATSTTKSNPTETSNSDNGNSGAGSGDKSSTVSKQCAAWSACSSEGIRTRICTQSNSKVASTEKQTCIPTQTKTQPNENPPVEKGQSDQGMGQKLTEQITERKAEIKSGDYTGSLGQLLRVKELAQNLKELRVNDVPAQTDLNIIAETDSNGKTKLKTMLKNGQEIEIKIMPDTASKRALEILKVKVCSSDNNCTIQLKDVGSGTAEKIQYEVQLERHSKLFGLFQKKMQVSADVDAQTGDTKVHKPWWAFIATEPAE
ncbi:MAG: ice-binding family protein [archaeon]